MTILNENDCLLLIIDIQEKLINAVFNKDNLRKKAAIISSAAKILDIPTLITEQYPKGLGSTIEEVRANVGKSSIYLEKLTFSAWDNQQIAEIIKKSGKKQIIVCGIETHICISQTVNALIENNYNVNVIADISGSRSEFEYQMGLDRIRENGGSIITTEIALFELLKSAKHSKFKEIQSLIK